MAEKTNKLVIPDEIITSKIYFIRDKKVMLDEDLAELYGVTTGNLNKAVKRNIARFPEDFMFQLTKEEFDNLIFQIGTSSWGGRRKPPYAFTEQGVAMLSGVLNSNRAIKVNIQIMRVFTRMRKMLETHKEILKKLEHLERKDIEQDEKIMLIFEYLKQLEQIKQEELEGKKVPVVKGFRGKKSEK
ncbi:MAG: ORF6N domain-containing protein [Bacteroidales bacterium]|nr:ORF6N domain-containing protein [Bacteroidales bacterium]